MPLNDAITREIKRANTIERPKKEKKVCDCKHKNEHTPFNRYLVERPPPKHRHKNKKKKKRKKRKK